MEFYVQIKKSIYLQWRCCWVALCVFWHLFLQVQLAICEAKVALCLAACSLQMKDSYLMVPATGWSSANHFHFESDSLAISSSRWLVLWRGPRKPSSSWFRIFAFLLASHSFLWVQARATSDSVQDRALAFLSEHGALRESNLEFHKLGESQTDVYIIWKLWRRRKSCQAS